MNTTASYPLRVQESRSAVTIHARANKYCHLHRSRSIHEHRNVAGGAAEVIVLRVAIHFGDFAE